VSVEEILDHPFQDADLLETALTHPSRAYEEGAGRGNERLEYLGDAVLGLLVAELLFETHPGWDEGDLTRARAALVNTRSLAERSRYLDLGRYALLGRTEARSGGADKDSILANLFEALLGALYLDAGLAVARAFVVRVFADSLDDVDRVLERDPKTRFQEWAHAQLSETPRYRPVWDTGVDDDEDRFSVEVRVGGEAWGQGTARTKRAAERAAAEAALRRADSHGA